MNRGRHSPQLVGYVNLSPARYRFRVIACNSDGVWNEAGAIIAFRIVPYFYQTTWFYAACILAAAFIAWGSHRLQCDASSAPPADRKGALTGNARAA